MFKRISPEERQAWKEKIELQRKSGKPITRWCKENGVAIGQFYYWKKQFFPQSIDRSEFLELSQTNKVGIKVECNGMHIYLEPNFDPYTLKQCLVILRELSC